METVLITGNLGYIGYILTEKLLNKNYNIRGIDTCFYNDKLLYESTFKKEFQQLRKDLRAVNSKDLKGIDAIIHLAALSNDPIGELNPKLTKKINLESSIRLAKLAKKAKVSRFLFSSSCSIYGATNNQQLSEIDSLNPISAYAYSKVAFEKALSKLADSYFSPVFMRNATAYGLSPNMRFDLVVNNLMGWAYTTNEIKILSDGKAWRPIVHIEDICDAFIAALEASRDKIHNEAFNVGINSENYQIKDIAEQIHKQMNDCKINIVGKNNPDQRDYIVNFDKIMQTLKNFKPKWNLKKGIEQLLNAFININLTSEIFQDRHYTRLKQLKYLMENNSLDRNLYWIKNN